ncbi:MAG: GSCFA domain-containing protein [Candidatus Korobacteraceae bacterium]
MRLSLNDAIQNSRNVGNARRFPTKDDPRVCDGAVFSKLFPRFFLTKGSSIFTLGSCFSRSIEEQLEGFLLPTRNFAVPESERLGRPNGILNEYNPGTMCQRVEYAAKMASFGELCIAPEGSGYIDLLLAEYVTPATKERLLERRAEVEKVYTALFESEAVIVTLDLVEVWYDKTAGLYLNRIPPAPLLFADRKRFEMHILDAHETQLLLERMVNALLAIGVRKILLMVSPVPLEVTYSGRDCTVANMYSKAVLVVSSNSVSRLYPEVDYFPGYEIVMSAGPELYYPNSINERGDIVQLVTSFLIDRYTRCPEQNV